MQTDEHQKFRFNWQVGVVTGVTMVALIIPLAGVAIGLQHLLNPRPSSVIVQAEPPFRKSLEDLVNQKLGSSVSFDAGSNSLLLLADNPAQEAARVSGLAKSCGGVALPSERAGENLRLTVQIPGNQLENFQAECRNPGTTAKPVGLDEARVLVEVVIKSKTP